ncbi:hypothetical protein, partial [Proteiniclasticum ruminis]|uniref:hypothetical protein n=1 Tax=Proteiniclasticum ruminis TaxID=398199 RepID=UPI0028A8C43A
GFLPIFCLIFKELCLFVFAALIKRLVYNSMVRNTKSTAFLKKSKEIIRDVFSKFSNSLNPFSLNS